MIRVIVQTLILMFVIINLALSQDAKIKDIAKVQSISDNQLVGYGLVVGLAGTGDTKNAYATIQSVANMLRNFGVSVLPPQIDKIKNVAAVIATASLPSYAKEGDKIDVIVSSLGDATSLEGGVLLLTPLIGADGEVYATAQGPVSVGGFNIKGGRQVQMQRNHPLVGRIPGGGIVARDLTFNLLRNGVLNLTLSNPDFSSAMQVANVINHNFKMNIAKAIDSSRVEIKIPDDWKDNIVEIISIIEDLSIVPSSRAVIVINERTGTVVIGKSVKIQPVAITHGNLTIKITDKTKIESSPFERNITASRKLDVEEPRERLFALPQGNTIEDIVKALNALGVTPRDLIAIIQAIHQAGAIQAEIKII